MMLIICCTLFYFSFEIMYQQDICCIDLMKLLFMSVKANQLMPSIILHNISEQTPLPPLFFLL
ncbi:hypothetical protein Patl1_04907 [Pistacia atlantica]|uniref:Uncharacterized protein n=1 Tax=Pistacia atlantica TaxID=434234 RepID=A0ACC1BPU9_9ROSI|nr:hypothetical protein Patl1_04907 [Pistacia atlantica]